MIIFLVFHVLFMCMCVCFLLFLQVPLCAERLHESDVSEIWSVSREMTFADVSSATTTRKDNISGQHFLQLERKSKAAESHLFVLSLRGHGHRLKPSPQPTRRCTPPQPCGGGISRKCYPCIDVDIAACCHVIDGQTHRPTRAEARFVVFSSSVRNYVPIKDVVSDSALRRKGNARRPRS